MTEAGSYRYGDLDIRQTWFYMHFRAMKPCLAYDSLKHLYYFKNQMSSVRKGASRGFDVQIWIPQRDIFLLFITTFLCYDEPSLQWLWQAESKGWGVGSIENVWIFSSVFPMCHHCVGTEITWRVLPSTGTEVRLEQRLAAFWTLRTKWSALVLRIIFFSARRSSSVMSFTLDANSFSAVCFI